MPEHRRARLNQLLGLVAFAGALACVHAVRPTASYRTLELGGGAAEVGVIAAAYASLSALAAVPLGSAIDRLGARTFLLAGIATVGAGALISASAPTILMLAVGQSMLGLGQVSATISFQSVQARIPGIAGDAAFARLAVAGSIGQMLGPLLAGFALQWSVTQSVGSSQTTGSFLVAGSLAALSLLLAFRVPGATESTRTSRSSSNQPVPIRALLRTSGMPQALTTSIAILTALDLLIAYLPVLGEERGVSPAVVGSLLALRAGAGVLSRLTMTQMIHRLGRRRLLAGATAVGGLAMLALAVFPPVVAMGACVFVIGFSLGVGTPMTAAWVAREAPARARAKALALRMTGNRTGQILVPLAVGGVASFLGAASVFAITATSLTGSSLWVRMANLDGDEPDDAPPPAE